MGPTAGWGGWEAGSQGGCGENEGGWSIPEAAGAKGCLLGCAGPTRGSFRAATPAEGRRGKEQDSEKEGGEPSQTLQGPPPDLGGQGSGWEGSPGGGGPHPPWSPSSWDSLEETHPGRWEMGPGWRGRNALKSVRSQ